MVSTCCYLAYFYRRMSATNLPYDSQLIAKYLYSLAYSKGRTLNVTQLQKLLYIAYGFYLAEHGRSLMSEQPQAWPFGPVFPRTRKLDYDRTVGIHTAELRVIFDDLEVRKLLDNVVDNYASISASKLSEWSHTVGSPWERTTLQNGFRWSHIIPDEYIAVYFKKFSI